MTGKINTFAKFCYTPVFERFKNAIDFSQPLKDQIGRMCYIIYRERIGATALASYENYENKKKEK